MTFDTLKPLFEHFKIQAHTFFTGVHRSDIHCQLFGNLRRQTFNVYFPKNML